MSETAPVLHLQRPVCDICLQNQWSSDEDNYQKPCITPGLWSHTQFYIILYASARVNDFFTNICKNFHQHNYINITQS